MTAVLRRRVLQSGVCVLSVQPNLAATKPARWIPLPDLPDVPLLDHDGRTVNLPRLLSQSNTTLIHFMFTGCRTVCPPGTAIVREALQLLRARDATRDALCVSVTVDPLGDGPTQLRQYAKRFDIALGVASGWCMVTGAAAPMASTLAALGMTTGAPSDHTSLVWIGDGQRQRWTRLSGLNPPQSLVDIALEVGR
jgi:protein SCO1